MRGFVFATAFASLSCGMVQGGPASAATAPERREVPGVDARDDALWRGLREHDRAANARARDGLVKLGAAIVPRLIFIIRECIGDEDETTWRSAYDVLERLGTPKGRLQGDSVFHVDELTAVDARLAEFVAGEKYESRAIGDVEFIHIPAGWSVSGTHVKAGCGGIAPPPPLRRVWQGDYWIAKYEITREQAESLGISLAWPPRPGLQPLPSPIKLLPIWPASVDWHKAQRWCEKFTSRIPTELGLKCTLPTELQWEKACRGDFGAHYPWGFGPPPGPFYPEVSGKEIGIPTATQIQLSFSQWRPGMIQFDRSPYGVIDMGGSGREWCAERLEKPYAPPVIGLGEVGRYAPYVVKGGDNRSDTFGCSRAGFGRSAPCGPVFRPVLVPVVPRRSVQVREAADPPADRDGSGSTGNMRGRSPTSSGETVGD